MRDDKSIFEPKEGFASEAPLKNPFAADDSASSPFASGPEDKSPFAANDDAPAPSGAEARKPAEKSPFGYEPPVAGFGGSPFGGSPSPSGSQDSPFALDEPEKNSPDPAPPKEEKAPSGPSAEVAAAVAAAAGTPPASQAAPVAASAPAPAPAATPLAESDSSSIRQLELRAIFGVDRELTESEMLQRSQALPGIRHLARIADADVGAIDSIKQVLGKLDFGGGKISLYCNDAPLEFIREGSVMLAVQNDGAFAPGVRETLMIVARELGRM
jgi:hypothetical protein